MSFNTAHDLRKRGFQLMTPPVTLVCMDPSGDGDDFDAIVALSREEHQRGHTHDPDFAVEFVYRVLMAHRLQQSWEFPDKLASLLALDRTLRGWTLAGRQQAHFFAIETNGVGYGYASSLAKKTTTKVMPYATVGKIGSTYRPPGNAKYAMPRLDALDNLRILVETGYIKIAPDCPGKKELQDEMAAFVWRKQNRPEAMVGQHDDLVMALAGATWAASKILPPILKSTTMRNTARVAGARMRIN
jgi:hypothetical protein